MSILDELLRSLEEAAERQRQATKPPQRPVVAHRELTAQEQRLRDERRQEQLRAQARAQRIAEMREESAADPEPEHRHRRVESSEAAPTAALRRRDHPLLTRLRDPAGVRESVILAEVLRRPGYPRR